MEKRFILTIDEKGKVAYKTPEHMTPEILEKMARISVALEPSWILLFFLKIEVILYKIMWFFRDLKEDIEKTSVDD
jgi:hypothetical protein